jgi:hypothetical protein
MISQSLSASALSGVAAMTGICKTDGYIQSAAKFSGGISLKVAIVVFASFEAVIRTFLLLAFLPIKLISPKTFANMTDKTSSAINTIFDGVKALSQFRAEEKDMIPVPKTWKETTKYSYNCCKDSQVMKIIFENKGLILAGIAVTVALWYNRHAIFNLLTPSGSANDFTKSNPTGTSSSEKPDSGETASSWRSYVLSFLPYFYSPSIRPLGSYIVPVAMFSSVFFAFKSCFSNKDKNINPIPNIEKFEVNKGEKFTVLGFYNGMTNNHGDSLEKILGFDDHTLEKKHNFIQWLFPIETVGVDHTAPLTDFETRDTFKEFAYLREKMKESFNLMLRFYGFQQQANGVVVRSSAYPTKIQNWLKARNHNFLRITRILKSLCLHGLQSDAAAFLKALEEVYEENKLVIGEKSMNFWKGSLHGSEDV